jgi:ATP-dependent RNA circularization protein (DNA/RNA ligase family)
MYRIKFWQTFRTQTTDVINFEYISERSIQIIEDRKKRIDGIVICDNTFSVLFLCYMTHYAHVYGALRDIASSTHL